MKILFAVNIGGPLYDFRRELVQECLNQGWEVFVSSSPSEKVDYFAQIGCNIIETPLESRGTNPIHDWKLIRFYKKMLLRIDPDIVLTFTQKPNIYCSYVCGKLGIPCIATITGLGSGIHDLGIILNRLIYFLYKRAFKKIPLVFFQNKWNLELLQTRGIVHDNVKLISGSGVNLEQHHFEAYPIDDGTIRILFVGRMLRDKGIGEYFNCIRRLAPKYPQCRFGFLGCTHKQFQKDIQELTESGYLTVYPQTMNVHPFMKDTHTVVLPSYHEGMANVLLEAAATGRPILASNIPGCCETFDEGVTGFGFKSRNTDDLTRTVEKFIFLPYEQKAAMGVKGRKKMEEEFDRKKVVADYMMAIKAFSLKRHHQDKC